MTSRSAQEATRLGTAAGGVDKRRGLRLGGAARYGGARLARGPSTVARGTAACGCYRAEEAQEVAARLRAWLASEAAAARLGCGGDLGAGHGGAG